MWRFVTGPQLLSVIFLQLSLLSDEECKDRLSADFDKFSMICTDGAAGQGTCPVSCKGKWLIFSMLRVIVEVLSVLLRMENMFWLELLAIPLWDKTVVRLAFSTTSKHFNLRITPSLCTLRSPSSSNG